MKRISLTIQRNGKLKLTVHQGAGGSFGRSSSVQLTEAECSKLTREIHEKLILGYQER